MNFIRLSLQRLRNRDLALLQTLPRDEALTCDELSLLKNGELGRKPPDMAWMVAILCALTIVSIEVIHQRCSQTALFTVEGMCCEYAAQNAAQRLTKVPGVVGIEPSYSANTLEVRVHCGTAVSPQQLWQAIQESDLRPRSLAYCGNTYRDRPTF